MQFTVAEIDDPDDCTGESVAAALSCLLLPGQPEFIAALGIGFECGKCEVDLDGRTAIDAPTLIDCIRDFQQLEWADFAFCKSAERAGELLACSSYPALIRRCRCLLRVCDNTYLIAHSINGNWLNCLDKLDKPIRRSLTEESTFRFIG